MASASFYHDTRRAKKDLLCPLRITIRHNQTAAQIPLDVELSPTQWNGHAVQNHPNEKTLNVILTKKMADVQSTMLLLMSDPKASFRNAAEIKDAVMERLYPDKAKPVQKEVNLFVPIYERFMAARKAEGTRVIYRRALDAIRKHDPDIDKKPISELNLDWLTAIDTQMALTNKKNTRSILLRSVRSVFNYAVSEGIISKNPFKGFDLKQEPTVKRSMDVETLRKIRDTEVAPWQEEYRDMFMLMFYLIGVNAADLFLAKKDQLVGDRFEYNRKKTGKHYSVKVQPEAMAIIEKYRGENWLLSPMDRYNNYKDYLQHMNKALSTLGQVYTTSSEKKGEVIFPKLSSYWSRHTWATLAYEIGIPIDVIGQALGHSDRQHVITFVYIRLDNKKVDEANRQVLDYVA
ncbi:MAG: phage integrase SAM-like domain-containing protein [Bacteroidales bacterium]|nr:phage integrase SAM-like domain-containing protein [Bacteroidales bacterium]MBQ7609751.1 phage integrase SAM-like domain-containing protein [Bacteroidales bacterium]